MKEINFYIDDDNNFRFSISNIDNKLFNDWLDSDVQNSQEFINDIQKSINKIKSQEISKDEFWGNDMVLFLDEVGARVRCNLAYDDEIEAPCDEFPMSETIPLKLFNDLINGFLKHI